MFKLDGRAYDVRVVYGTMTRAFEIIEGPNAGKNLNDARIRDIIGTEITYSVQIEPNPAAQAEYDDFYDAIAAPQDVHAVEFPYGQNVLKFDAVITGGADTFRGNLASTNRWAGLSLTFAPVEPQKK